MKRPRAREFDEGDDDGARPGEDALADHEWPEEFDLDHDEPALVACPHCGKSVLEDAPVCHRCGFFLSDVDSSPRRPLWMMLGAILVLLSMVYWSLR